MNKEKYKVSKLILLVSLIFIFSITIINNTSLGESDTTTEHFGWTSPTFSKNIYEVVEYNNGTQSKVDFDTVTWANVDKAGLWLGDNKKMIGGFDKTHGQLILYANDQYEKPPIHLFLRTHAEKDSNIYTRWLTKEVTSIPEWSESTITYNHSGELINGTEVQLGYRNNLSVLGQTIPTYVGIKADQFHDTFKVPINITTPVPLDDIAVEYIFVVNPSFTDQAKKLKYVMLINKNGSTEKYELSQLVNKSGTLDNYTENFYFLTENNKTISWIDFTKEFELSYSVDWLIKEVTLPNGNSTYVLSLYFWFGALNADETLELNLGWTTPLSVSSNSCEAPFNRATLSIDDDLGTEWIENDLADKDGATYDWNITYNMGSSGWYNAVRVYADGDAIDGAPCSVGSVKVCDDAACSGESNLLSGPSFRFSLILAWQNITFNATEGQYIQIKGGIHEAPFCQAKTGNAYLKQFYEFDANETSEPDFTAPVITISSPIEMVYNTTIIDLNVSADETIDTWQYNLNSQGNNSFSPNTTIIAQYGSNSIIVYGNDTSGNVNSSTVTFNTSEYIDECSVLNEANFTYYLNSDIIDTPSKCCINITANNVTFDGNEHIINSNGGSNDINPELGICVFRDSATNTSISLFDFNASDFYRGIHLNNSNAISINNVNFYEGDNPPTAWIGIFADSQSSNLNLTNINSKNSTQGIYLRHGSDNVRIINLTTNDCTDGVYLNNVSEIYAQYLHIENMKDGFFSINSDNIQIYDSVFNENNTDPSYGVNFRNVDNLTIKNATISGLSNTGMYLRNITNVTIYDSKIYGNDDYGIYLREPGSENTVQIYNNIINQTTSIYFEPGESFDYDWNTTNQTGTRIIGNGNNIAGNAWINGSGTGYYYSCTDSDNNGFCDSPYNITSDSSCTSGVDCGDNTDYLPLSDEYSISHTPNITEVQTVGAITLTEFTTKTLNILFNVTDADGYANLNDSLAECNLSKAGEATRQSSSCTAQSQSGNALVYNCSLTMYFYDDDGLWNITCYAEDITGLNDTNGSETATVNALNYITQDILSLTWSIYANTNDKESTNPIIFTNGGNQDYTTVSITSHNATNSTSTIPDTAFMVDNETSQSSGQTYLNDSGVTWSGGSLPRCTSPCSTNSTENAYFYADIPATLPLVYTSISEWAMSFS